MSSPCLHKGNQKIFGFIPQALFKLAIARAFVVEIAAAVANPKISFEMAFANQVQFCDEFVWRL